MLDVIFASGKRKDFLLLLKEGPQEMETVLDSLDTTRQALLPQIKVLEEHHLVIHYDDIYELSTIGKLVIDKMKTLLNTIEVFDNDIDYWGTRDLGFIPSHLLNKTNEFEKCQIVKPSLIDIYELDKRFHEGSKNSDNLYIVTTFLHPHFPELMFELIEKKVMTHFIISDELLRKLLETKSAEFMQIFQSSFVQIYICNKEMNFHFVSSNDYYLMLSILKNGGVIDNRYILCKSKKAVEWGQEFFKYCLKHSKLLTGI
ncbi:helix-turn-helix transcriptional regulator [Methanolobus halotolerans]|uniref:helix-turn-helix transcriptional regulator n=1 Tax=Methanolobus halotolerans TaxID=2052935 RepID=UPI001F168FDD|nr:winged helix-turn-helix domain-containing protein [Methanolobus halotolerans]